MVRYFGWCWERFELSRVYGAQVRLAKLMLEKADSVRHIVEHKI